MSSAQGVCPEKNLALWQIQLVGWPLIYSKQSVFSGLFLDDSAKGSEDGWLMHSSRAPLPAPYFPACVMNRLSVRRPEPSAIQYCDSIWNGMWAAHRAFQGPCHKEQEYIIHVYPSGLWARGAEEEEEEEAEGSRAMWTSFQSTPVRSRCGFQCIQGSCVHLSGSNPLSFPPFSLCLSEWYAQQQVIPSKTHISIHTQTHTLFFSELRKPRDLFLIDSDVW